MSDKIKVVGYTQKISYNNDTIQYRPYNPDLVGLQLASNGGTPLLTIGNFSITTNLEPKLDKFHNISQFSNFVTLSDLNTTLEQTKILLSNNAGVILNLDKSKLDNYALFGSLSEFFRVSLENIIINWPASLYMTGLGQLDDGRTVTGYTVENYVYDNINEISKFKINTNFINNNFQINYLIIGNIINSFSIDNDLRNITVNYKQYSILYNNVEYPIINFTGSTSLNNDYIYLEVNGKPFSGTSSNLILNYHIKPNKNNEEIFFNTLDNFSSYLLSRDVTPLYTAKFTYPIKSDEGMIMYITDSLTWPTTDGYNIDFDTTEYTNYATKLFNLANSNDLVTSNLLTRFLVSESITAFDTVPVHLSSMDQETSGQKVNKMLQIYGVNFDDINKFINGIQFANTVTYDKKDNTPDIFLKNTAKVLGWDLISSVLENDLLASYVTTKESTYSGTSVGLTPVQADIELWRRLILNTPWIWKSKGARKSIEFFLKFIGIPQDLVKFNEYIYKAKSPINLDLFKKVLEANNLNTDLNIYPIDSEGYPRPLPNTDTMFYQNNGLWYRETGGSGSTIDVLNGNNPHIGPYDGGYKYIKQFENIIPDFKPVTLTSSTITTDINNLYTNYDLGTFDSGITTSTIVDTTQILSDNGLDVSDCIVYTPTIQNTPIKNIQLNDCGCEQPTSNNILSLCVNKKKNKTTSICSNLVSTPSDTSNLGYYNFLYYQYYQNGSIFEDVAGNPILNSSIYASKECCKLYNGTPFLYDTIVNGVNKNTGYICCASNKCGCTIACNWMVDLNLVKLPLLSPIYNGTQDKYLQFIKKDGTLTVVTPDGCNCIPNYTTPVANIVDPYTNQIGYGCQLNTSGENDLALGTFGNIYKFYKDRSDGNTSCYN
jgi:hypothetical protein